MEIDGLVVAAAAVLVLVARMRSWMAMTLRRFLYLSMSFSKVGSRAREETYSEEVVLDRRTVPVIGCLLKVLNVSFFTMWVAIDAESGWALRSL